MTAPAGAAAGVWTERDTAGSNAAESGDLQNPLQCAKLQLLHSHRVDTLQGQQGLNLEKYELLESWKLHPPSLHLRGNGLLAHFAAEYNFMSVTERW